MCKKHGVDLRKFSTFWPDDYKPWHIKKLAAEAYEDAIRSGVGVDGSSWQGVARNGFPVAGKLDAGGNIVSAYPDYLTPKVKP